MPMTAPGQPFETASQGSDPTLSETLRQVVGFWRRNARAILRAAVVCAVVAGVIAVFTADRYRSSVMLLVELPASNPLSDEQTNQSAQDAFIEGQVFILRSSNVLATVVEDLDLTSRPFFQSRPGLISRAVGAVSGILSFGSGSDEALPDDLVRDPATEDAIRILRENIAVRRQNESNVLRVDVSAPGAALAARIASALADAFIANREEAQFESVARVAGWLDGREAQLRAQLNEAEAAVAEFRIQNNLITTDAGTLAAEQQLNELNTELTTTRSELAQRRAAYDRALELLNSGQDIQSLPEVQASPIISELRTQLLTLERRLAEFGEGSTSRVVTALREEQSATRTQIETEVQRFVNVLRNEVDTLETREANLQQRIRETEAEAGQASRLTVRLRELERQAEAYRLLYERYLESAGLTEERISFRISGVEVIDPASVPPGPYYPPTKLLVLAGLLGGLLLGTLYCMLRDALRPGFENLRDLRNAVNLPVLGLVPSSDDPLLTQTSTQTSTAAAFAEALNTIRHRLGQQHDLDLGQVVQITSSVPGEGKTTLSYALARSAEENGLKVLLVDGDLRRRGLSHLMGMESDTGLSETLQAQEWVFTDSDSGIEIMPAGDCDQSPTDILSSEHLADYLDEARDYYDLIIVDGPPVVDLADANILAKACDVVAYVVRWRATPTEVVVEALERFEMPRYTGVILNQANLSEIASYDPASGAYGYRAQPKAV